VSVAQILDFVQTAGQSDDIALWAWVPLAPREAARLEFPRYGISKGHDKILLLTRPVAGGSDINAQIVFTSLDVHFKNLRTG
jgi:hypothetical protein